MKNYILTQGFLLKKVLLPNDDAIVEFFTPKKGRVSVIIKKLAVSKKKNAEMDYFRLLDLNLIEHSSFYRLQEISTARFFSVFQSSPRFNALGFSWLELLKKVMSEDQPEEEIFSLWVSLLENLKEDNADLFDLYFRMQILISSGLFVRFDQMRGDVFFDPLDLSFSAIKKTQECIFIPHKRRQMIEFLRRSSLEEVLLKKNHLPLGNHSDILFLIHTLERNHY